MPSRSMAMNSFTGPPGTWRRAASDAWHERLGRAGLAHAPREGGDQTRRGLQVVAVRDLERRVHVADREAQRERRGGGGHELVGVGGHRLGSGLEPVSYTHLRAHETRHDLVCRLLLEKKKKKKQKIRKTHLHGKK